MQVSALESAEGLRNGRKYHRQFRNDGGLFFSVTMYGREMKSAWKILIVFRTLSEQARFVKRWIVQRFYDMAASLFGGDDDVGMTRPQMPACLPACLESVAQCQSKRHPMCPRNRRFYLTMHSNLLAARTTSKSHQKGEREREKNHG